VAGALPRDALTPGTVKILAERKDLADDVKAKIIGGNAMRFYRLS
jgi:hypothetical protein